MIKTALLGHAWVVTSINLQLLKPLTQLLVIWFLFLIQGLTNGSNISNGLIIYSIINSITPIGRATIMCLRLNRIGLVNLRRVLVTAQKHPKTQFNTLPFPPLLKPRGFFTTNILRNTEGCSQMQNQFLIFQWFYTLNSINVNDALAIAAIVKMRI